MSVREKSWEDVQVKAFTHWVNSYLASKDMKVESLGNDFGDGTRLIALIEALTGLKLKKKYNKQPKTRVHYIENCHLGLMLLKEANRVKNVSQFGAEDFADCNLKLILGFLWTLLRTFRIGMGDGAQSDDKRFEDVLLQWLKDTLAEYELPITDFTNSFQDGRILLALLNKFDGTFVDWATVDASKKLDNNQSATKIAEEKLSIPVLVEPTELAAGEADERSVVLYVSLLQHAFVQRQKERESAGEKAGLTNKMGELTAQLQAEIDEKTSLQKLRDDLNSQLAELRAQLEEQKRLNEELRKKNQDLEAENDHLRKTGGSLEEKEKYLNEKIDVMKTLLQQETDEKTELTAAKDKLDRDLKNLTRDKQELELERDSLIKEKESLENEQRDMLEAMDRFAAAKKRLEADYKGSADLNLKGLDVLRKNLLEHLRDMNKWKDYLEQDRDYKSGTIQQVTEQSILKSSFDDQLAVLSTALKAENTKLQALLKERELEEASAAKAAKADGKAADAKPSGDGKSSGESHASGDKKSGTKKSSKDKK